MSKKGPIIIIDDDPDDQEMIQRIISKLNLENEIKKFLDGEEALQYLMQTQDNPLLILCDINMPLMNGIDLKKNIQADMELARKRTPFVFLTTTANPDQIIKAFGMDCHGFFIKGQSYGELKDTVTKILTYWISSEHPQ